ncbi:MAG TPA: PP0621 family protein [Accumulibacter sp.]|nr:PP0621 family protein [Accumulibacter sp.]
MGKYLLLFAFLCVVWWIWRKSQATKRALQRRASIREVEPMVACAHCGVNHPISESLRAGGRYYCCLAHQREAEPTGQ